MDPIEASEQARRQAEERLRQGVREVGAAHAEIARQRARNPRAARQARVAKLVWGTLFVVMGVLFTLHDMGRIDLGEPPEELSAERAVDGDDRTRWGSAFGDPQWLMVDLGEAVPLSRVRLRWEAAYAKSYDIQVSSDGVRWTTVRHETSGQGGVEEQDLGTTARYVRMVGLRRATPYGYSLWEMQVFDAAGNIVSQGRTVRASSLESHGPFVLWLRFWPLLLVAAGLPLLIAPRDDTSQVFGMVLTAAGTCLQLHTLGILPWGLRQTAAAVLIVVGMVVLLQSQRRGERSDEGGRGPTGSAS